MQCTFYILKFEIFILEHAVVLGTGTGYDIGLARCIRPSKESRYRYRVPRVPGVLSVLRPSFSQDL